MTPLRRRLLSCTALMLSFTFSSACLPPSSKPQLASEEPTGADDAEAALDGASSQLDPMTGEGVVADTEPEHTPEELPPQDVPSNFCPPPSTTEGRTWLVPGEVGTIQGAIDLASPGDTVKVAPGTYYEHLELAEGVQLVGSGADSTILDGNGEGRNLIELIGWHDVLVQGFTLRGVGQTEVCDSSDPISCSGNWYASALYVAPFDTLTVTCPASITVVQNVFEENDIGMMVYFTPHVVLQNNVFSNNRVGFVANHHGDGTGLISQNVFFRNEAQALVLQASFIDVENNIFAMNGIAFERQYVQEGTLSCNVFFANSSLGEIELGVNGNVELDPMFASPETGDFSLLPGSPAASAGCPWETPPEIGEGGAGGG